MSDSISTSTNADKRHAVYQCVSNSDKDKRLIDVRPSRGEALAEVSLRKKNDAAQGKKFRYIVEPF